MNITKNEIINFVSENDIKFIRLAFCDIFGTQKNISITPRALKKAFEEGISFDASAFAGFMKVEASDLLLFPDPSTLSVLPWRSFSEGDVIRLYCNIKYPNGMPFEGDGRYLLQNAVKEARKQNLTCMFGTECEFYLFEDASTLIPYDNAGYFDVAPLDKGENVRRQICITLEEMGIHPESSHHEQGPGQNEIDFKYADALEAADNFITFKAVVKNIASANGLFASFLPKPLSGKPGNGVHINLSLFRNGENIFQTQTGTKHSAICESFIAGILYRVREISLFLNTLTNSYARFGEFEAPKYVTWSHQNRSQLIRIPHAKKEMQRMELRSPDPCFNPYLAFTLLIYAGLEGISKQSPLPKPCNLNLFSASHEDTKEYEILPQTLNEAIMLAKNSNIVKSIVPERTLKSYLAVKQREWETFFSSSDRNKIEYDMYFQRY